MINWSQACSYQYHRPVSQLEEANYGGCVFAITLFAFAAVYNAVWLGRWRRKGAEQLMWPQLGVFCALVCLGSIAGAVAWASQMRSNSSFYAANARGISVQQRYALTASVYRWYAAFVICYGVEFLCLVIPKLMLLGRLADNAASLLDRATARNSARDTVSKSLENIGLGHENMNSHALLKFHKVMTIMTVICSAVSMVAFDTAGAYFVQASVLSDQRAAVTDPRGGESNASLALSAEANSAVFKAYTSEAVQNVSEAVALLLVSVSYVVLVTACVVLFRRAELIAAHALNSATLHDDDIPMDLSRGRALVILEDSMHAAAEQRRRLLLACVVVLITFPIRVAFDLLQAYSSLYSPYNSDCGICDPCQSESWLIYQWLTYTPELWSVVVTISSPVPLILSLWLITSAHARALALARNVQQAGLAEPVL